MFAVLAIIQLAQISCQIGKRVFQERFHVDDFPNHFTDQFIVFNDVCWIGEKGKVTWLADCKYNGTHEGFTNTMYIRRKNILEIRLLDASFQTILIDKEGNG